MKNTIFAFLAALFLGFSANAQSTADSIAAKYHLLTMPAPLTIEKTFPVLGSYQLNTADGASQTVVVSLDQNNKGIVWIEGLPVGKMKAYLKQSPATYRVLAQKTESGKQIPEGTLIFDPSTNVLNIAIGKPFDSAEPASVFSLNSTASADPAGSNGSSVVKLKSKTAASKTKSKVFFYSANKTEDASAAVTPAASTNGTTTTTQQ